MANVLANYISNNTNTAYFMNALKLDRENRTITLYNTTDQAFSSSVQIPEQAAPNIDNVPFW